MGGKHKVANRTKNNARPSSSGRSAELLGTQMPQFIGFPSTANKDNSLLLPGFSVVKSDEIDGSVDPQFQLALKKIVKKDSKTKLKGLQELTQLVNESDCETVKGVLPLWPRYYSVLATDTDNRVREAAHTVHHAIVLKVKRNIAPYLKQLMAPWFTSQYDNYAPAATVALQAFKDAFPPNKFQEAIVFCQEEILAYINDNLLVQTAQTITNSKIMSAEDAEDKYKRILISCLQGYALYLDKVTSKQIENIAALNNEIISNHKFWKLAKHEFPPVRLAFFKVLTALCQKAIFLLDGKESQVTNAIFGNLEESDPTVLPFVWESALLTMSSLKNWWTYVNVDKMYLPKLWSILKKGGHGNATVIFPNLLPILSHLPPSVESKANEFYNTFFENLQSGLKQKSVISSRSETTAVATALIECLQYVILKNETDNTLCKQLIKNHIIATVEWCLVENQSSYKTIFNQISSIVQYWSRSCKQFKMFNEFLQFFFDNIKDLFKETLFNLKQHENYDISNIATLQVEFLQSLKRLSKPKKQYKVKFAISDEDEREQIVEDSQSIVESDKSYFDRLNVVVYDICEDYVNCINEKLSKELFVHLYSLIIDFNSEKFFVNLNEKMKNKNENSQLIDVYNILLCKWLKSNDLCCKYVVDLIFLLFEYVDEINKQIILNSLNEIVSDESLGWCISEALSFPHNQEPLVKNWLKTDKVSNYLILIAEKEISNSCSAELSALFKLALTEIDGELLIRETAILEIIKKFVITLQHFSDFPLTIDTCSRIASYISTIIYTENLLLTYGDQLLITLFEMSCQFTSETETISSETLYELNSSWQDIVTMLSANLNTNEFITLTEKFANIVETQFKLNVLNRTCVDHLIAVIGNFFKAIFKSIPLMVNRVLNVFFERDFVPIWRNNITDICKVAEYVKGNLSSPYEEVSCGNFEAYDENILQYFVWSYLKIGVLSCEIEEENYDDEEEGTECENKWMVHVIDNNEELLADILYNLSVSQSFLDNYKNTKTYINILEFNKLTLTSVTIIIHKFNDTFTKKLQSILSNKINQFGWFWCKTVRLFYEEVYPQLLTNVFQDVMKNIFSNLSILHMIQVFGDELKYEYVDDYCKSDTVSRVIVLRSLLHCDEMDVPIAEVFGKIEQIRNENNSQFSYDNVNVSWETSQQIIEIVRLCHNLIDKKYDSLTRRHWDFGVLSLTSWANNCLKLRTDYEKFHIQAYINATSKLFTAIDNRIKILQQENVASNYINEWNELFIETIHTDFSQLWLYLAEQIEMKQNNLLTFLPFLQEFGMVINNFNSQFIFNVIDTSLSKWTKFLKRSCSLLGNSSATLQLWGYKVLIVLVPELVKIDAEVVNNHTPHRKGLVFEHFKEKLLQTHEIVNTMLEEFKLGEESCRVEPSTDSFTYTFGYLLLWDVLLTLCEQSPTELRFQYADWLKNEDLLLNFLNNIFRLMPAEILQYNEGKSKSLVHLFLERPKLLFCDTCNSETIERLVCWVYSYSLGQLPVLVRQWWTNIHPRISQIVDKITTMYVSQHLCTAELNDVMQHQTKFKNMVIKVIPSVREVIAIYTVDEAQMELVITLPQNYPLGGPLVECNRQIGGTTHKQWLLQLKKCVLHQNGRIWDALSIWNNNLDRKFDGVEECYICFAVLHPGTYQLPKLSCQTCRKKFHSACLYKWFSTSNKSTCPICRNLF